MTPKQFAQYLTDAGAEVRLYTPTHQRKYIESDRLQGFTEPRYYAFDVPSFADALAIVADAAMFADRVYHAEEFVTACKHARVDTLGRGLIVYFPTMEVANDE